MEEKKGEDTIKGRNGERGGWRGTERNAGKIGQKGRIEGKKK